MPHLILHTVDNTSSTVALTVAINTISLPQVAGLIHCAVAINGTTPRITPTIPMLLQILVLLNLTPVAAEGYTYVS